MLYVVVKPPHIGLSSFRHHVTVGESPQISFIHFLHMIHCRACDKDWLRPIPWPPFQNEGNDENARTSKF